MAKISKNIKKLRSDKKFTQDALAVKMNVTRQTISSWETGRTLPDIEMIENLADVFGVSVEEIIYGHKTKVGLEAEKRDKRKIMGIIFAVIGSAFTAAGIVILFVNFWKTFFLPVQTVFSFLPLGAGAAFAVFVYLKKRESLVLMESSACVWGIGMIATNALINSVYSVHLGFDNLLLIDAVFVFFIGLLMDSAGVKTAFFVLIDIWFWRMFSEDSYIQIALFFILLFAGTFVYLFKKSEDNIKAVPVGWVSVLSWGMSICAASAVFDRNDTDLMLTITVIPAVLTALYALDNGKRKFYPFRYPAVLGIVVYYTVFSINSLTSSWSSEPEFLADYNIAGVIFSLLLIAAAAFAGKESIKSNPLKILFILLSACLAVLIYLLVLTPYVTVLLDIILIVAGIKYAKILTANLGLLSICVLLITVIFGSDIHIILKGAVCVAIGVLLILSNTFMSKYFSKKKEAQNNG